jgi:hypothetical protein
LTRGRSVEDGWLRPGRQLAALEEAAHDLTAHRVEQPHDHAAVARWVWLRCGAWWVVEHLRPRPCRGTTLKQEPIELVLRWSSDHRHVCVVWRVACAPATRHARCTRPSPSLRCASLSSGGKTRSFGFFWKTLHAKPNNAARRLLYRREGLTRTRSGGGLTASLLNDSSWHSRTLSREGDD